MKDEGRRNIRRGKESDTKQDEIRKGGKARGGGVGGERRKNRRGESEVWEEW